MKTDRKNFYADIYDIVGQIPAGKVCTYGLLARLAGRPRHARLAGRAVAEVPETVCLPCHRVVNGQGRLVPGWREQRELLLEEGVSFKKNGCVDLKKCLWEVWEM